MFRQGSNGLYRLSQEKYMCIYVQSGKMKSSNYIQEGKAWPDAAETSSLSPPFQKEALLSTFIYLCFSMPHLIPFYEAESIILFASLSDRRSALVLPLISIPLSREGGVQRAELDVAVDNAGVRVSGLDGLWEAGGWVAGSTGNAESSLVRGVRALLCVLAACSGASRDMCELFHLRQASSWRPRGHPR